MNRRRESALAGVIHQPSFGHGRPAGHRRRGVSASTPPSTVGFGRLRAIHHVLRVELVIAIAAVVDVEKIGDGAGVEAPVAEEDGAGLVGVLVVLTARGLVLLVEVVARDDVGVVAV